MQKVEGSSPFSRFFFPGNWHLFGRDDLLRMSQTFQSSAGSSGTRIGGGFPQIAGFANALRGRLNGDASCAQQLRVHYEKRRSPSQPKPQRCEHLTPRLASSSTARSPRPAFVLRIDPVAPLPRGCPASESGSATPAARVLLSCLQRPSAWLALGASSSALERSGASCSLSAQSEAVIWAEGMLVPWEEEVPAVRVGPQVSRRRRSTCSATE